MKEYLLHREQYLRAPIDEVFAFFADVRNLEQLTPPWLGFRILTPAPIEMKAGARIDFRIRLAGVPVRWRTRIKAWKPGVRFVDAQERGPYTLWHHEHLFEPVGGGVLMTDYVRYRLPWGLLGRAVHALAVRAAVASIFDYRFRRIRERFGGHASENAREHAAARAADRSTIAWGKSGPD